MTAKVVSFINMKGGVSKTTLAKEFALHFSEREDNKKRVLLIDVDPQMNLTQSIFSIFGYAPSREIADNIEKENENNGKTSEKNPKSRSLKVSEASIASIFSGNISGDVEYEKAILGINDYLSIIPGELGIDFLNRNLDSSAIEKGIYNFIDQHTLKESFDYIFIDCPPTYSSYTVGALVASDHYIIPVRPEAYSILGINMLLQVVSSVQKNNRVYFQDSGLTNLGIVFTSIHSSPRKGIENLISDIKLSKSFKTVPKFDNNFLYNPELSKNLSYNIMMSNSLKSKNNLRVLVNEFESKL